MINYKNLYLLGTSHIAIQSIKEVENFILKEKPYLIALELDKKRLQALMNEGIKLSLRDIKYLGIKVFLLNLVGSFIERKLGEKVGIKPGSEMKKALQCARKVGAKIALIDQDIKLTLKNLVKTPFREFLKLIFDSLFGIIFKREFIKIDLTKVPKKMVINKVLKIVKIRYPHIYKSLIDDRNKIMAKRLEQLMKIYKDKKILAIVGAGHEEEVIRLIKNVY